MQIASGRNVLILFPFWLFCSLHLQNGLATLLVSAWDSVGSLTIYSRYSLFPGGFLGPAVKCSWNCRGVGFPAFPSCSRSAWHVFRSARTVVNLWKCSHCCPREPTFCLIDSTMDSEEKEEKVVKSRPRRWNKDVQGDLTEFNLKLIQK